MHAMALESEREEEADDREGGGASGSAAEGDDVTVGWQSFTPAALRGPLALGAVPTVAALVALQIGLGVLAVELMTFLLAKLG